MAFAQWVRYLQHYLRVYILAHSDTINVTLALGMNEKIPIILSKAITEVQVCHQSLLS